jgi:hypothetical protein
MVFSQERIIPTNGITKCLLFFLLKTKRLLLDGENLLGFGIRDCNVQRVNKKPNLKVKGKEKKFIHLIYLFF